MDSTALRRRTTELLIAASDGEASAVAELEPVLYGELRRIAESLMQGERRGHTLQPTALVHEAWLRLIDGGVIGTARGEQTRRRFVALTVQAMRRVLIDHARQRKADRRGGGKAARVVLHDSLAILTVDDDFLLDLENALSRLAEQHPRLAQVAELKLFGGLSFAELAPIAETSVTGAKRDWAFARALLTKLLGV